MSKANFQRGLLLRLDCRCEIKYIVGEKDVSFRGYSNERKTEKYFDC